MIQYNGSLNLSVVPHESCHKMTTHNESLNFSTFPFWKSREALCYYPTSCIIHCSWCCQFRCSRVTCDESWVSCHHSDLWLVTAHFTDLWLVDRNNWLTADADTPNLTWIHFLLSVPTITNKNYQTVNKVAKYFYTLLRQDDYWMFLASLRLRIFLAIKFRLNPLIED